jgi:tetrahydromethanopterin S-methyltransferase subunit G
MDWLILENLIQVAAIVTAITILTVGIIKVTKFFKKTVHFFDDFLGEEERPGVPTRPGMSERISNMESCIKKVDSRLEDIEGKVVKINYELQPNSGMSIKDAINRIEKRVNEIEVRVNDRI